MSVIEKCLNNNLHAFDVFFGVWGCGVRCDCLHLCPELGWDSLVWCMLWLQRNLVLVFEESLTGIVWHVKIYHMIDLVPR